MSDWRFMWLFPEEREIEFSTFLRIKADEEGLWKKLKDIEDVSEANHTYRNFIAGYSEITGNKVELLKQLRGYKDKSPDKVAREVSSVAQNYNQRLDQSLQEFPKTFDTFWQMYRRSGEKMTLPHGFVEEGDAKISEFIRATSSDNCPETFIDFGAVPSYEVIETKEGII